MKQRVTIDGPETGQQNMLLDLALHEEVRSGDLLAGLRFYSWQPWCVSLGKHQDRERLNQRELKRLHFDVVHRPTGGRAVLHANEVTYCVCMPLPDASKAQLVYGAIHDMLYGILSSLARDLVHASLTMDLRTHYNANQSLGQACFSSHAKSEILWSNKKVVGSAQRVMDDVLLQHGSILCGAGHEQLAKILTQTSDEADRVQSALGNASATLSQAANRDVTIDDVLSAAARHKDTLCDALAEITSLVVGAES